MFMRIAWLELSLEINFLKCKYFVSVLVYPYLVIHVMKRIPYCNKSGQKSLQCSEVKLYFLAQEGHQLIIWRQRGFPSGREICNKLFTGIYCPSFNRFASQVTGCRLQYSVYIVFLSIRGFHYIDRFLVQIKRKACVNAFG